MSVAPTSDPAGPPPAASAAGTTRRDLIRYGSAAAVLMLAGRLAIPSWAAAGNGVGTTGPYGPLGTVDANGLRLPAGFTSRVVARSRSRVTGTDYRWHDAPDGGACFPTADGFVYVSNSEVGNGRGGVGAIEFDRDGDIVDAYRLLDGTSRNCSGGATPWGTWLSCEENGSSGRVHECFPLRDDTPRARPSMGRFNHEAAVPVAGTDTLEPSFIMTEDDPQGRLYRFVPTTWGSLTRGRLQAADVAVDGSVTWVAVSTQGPERSARTTPFDGGEGLAVLGTDVFVATKGDCRLWRLDMAAGRIDVIHDCIAEPNTVLDSVDGLLVDQPTGDLFVAEDGSTTDVALVSATADGRLGISPFVRFVGHEGSEVTGLALDPARTTMILSSQRGTSGTGITYAITGPFRDAAPPPTTTTSTSTSTTSTSTTSTSTTSTSTTSTSTTSTPAASTTVPTSVPATSPTTTPGSAPTTTAPSTTAPSTTVPTVPTVPTVDAIDASLSSSRLRRATRLSRRDG